MFSHFFFISFPIKKEKETRKNSPGPMGVLLIGKWIGGHDYCKSNRMNYTVHFLKSVVASQKTNRNFKFVTKRDSNYRRYSIVVLTMEKIIL